MAGELVYFWIPVPDAERAQAFYGGLFGWEFEPGPSPNGVNITNASPPAGIHGGDEASAPQVCFGVEDIDAAMAQVRELGGEAGEPQATSGGSYSMCSDDQGSSFCIWAAAS